MPSAATPTLFVCCLLCAGLLWACADAPSKDVDPQDLAADHDPQDAALPPPDGSDVAPEADLADLADGDLSDADLPSDLSPEVAEVDVPELDLAEDLAPDLAEDLPELPPQPDFYPADDYCERSVDFFCDYYVRCGRMAVADVAACRVAFLETCNARYEPHYAALEAAGWLRLSRLGLEACAAHLATVTCSAQIFDLDLGCAQVWQGRRPAGAACGLGVESFICDADATCVIGMDFCGTCRAAAVIDAPCGGELTCEAAARCIEGTCRERVPPGSACDATTPCKVGSSCQDGRCADYVVVALDEACDASRRCPYLSQCVSGVCRATGLHDAPCDAQRPCAAGRCVQGLCVDFLDPGATCSASAECRSGRCVNQRCDDYLSACVSGT